MDCIGTANNSQITYDLSALSDQVRTFANVFLRQLNNILMDTKTSIRWNAKKKKCHAVVIVWNFTTKCIGSTVFLRYNPTLWVTCVYSLLSSLQITYEEQYFFSVTDRTTKKNSHTVTSTIIMHFRGGGSACVFWKLAALIILPS